jgi:uridine phosphorylase
MAVNDGGVPPILAERYYTQPSAFALENRLRKACGQQRIMGFRIPVIFVFDPDREACCDGLRSRRRP